MKKQQKQSELEKRIEAIKFIDSLEEFKVELEIYTKRPEFKPCPYEIKIEVEDVIEIAMELEQRLEYLAEYAEKWEALE